MIAYYFRNGPGIFCSEFNNPFIISSCFVSDDACVSERGRRRRCWEHKWGVVGEAVTRPEATVVMNFVVRCYNITRVVSISLHSLLYLASSIDALIVVPTRTNNIRLRHSQP